MEIRITSLSLHIYHMPIWVTGSVVYVQLRTHFVQISHIWVVIMLVVTSIALFKISEIYIRKLIKAFCVSYSVSSGV